MAHIPVLRLRDTLIAVLDTDVSDRDALACQEEINVALEQGSARSVLLDLSLVEVVDSFLARVIHDVASGASLLGAHTVVVGLQPAVAITLVELGLDLKGVLTALNVDRGLTMLQQLRARGEHRGRYQAG
jgi:rsbT antagonist protein RsbS